MYIHLSDDVNVLPKIILTQNKIIIIRKQMFSILHYTAFHNIYLTLHVVYIHGNQIINHKINIRIHIIAGCKC